MGLLTIALVGGGAAGAVVAAPLVLAGVGFTAGGIAAGSIASKMMAAAAIANGGGVAAGSIVSLGQAAGAAGIPAVVNAALAGTGATLGWLAAIII